MGTLSNLTPHSGTFDADQKPDSIYVVLMMPSSFSCSLYIGPMLVLGTACPNQLISEDCIVLGGISVISVSAGHCFMDRRLSRYKIILHCAGH